MLVSLGRWQHSQMQSAPAVWRPEQHRAGREEVGLALHSEVELLSWGQGLGWGAWGYGCIGGYLAGNWVESVEPAQHPHRNAQGSVYPNQVSLSQLQLIVRGGAGRRCPPWGQCHLLSLEPHLQPPSFLVRGKTVCRRSVGTVGFASTYLQAAVMIVCYFICKLSSTFR